MAVLDWLSTHGGVCFPLLEPRMHIGRHGDCEIMLDRKHISRRHACIHRVDGQFLIEDMGSRNGTRVNGTKISGRELLTDGDSIQIDREEFLFRMEEPPAEVERPSEVMGTLFVEHGSVGQGETNPELRLQAVMDVSSRLARSVSEDDILENLLKSLFTVFPQADRGLVMMPRRDGEMHLRSYRCQQGRTFPATISRSVARQVLNNSQAILSYDAADDERFDSSASLEDANIRSMMCAPLPGREGKALGVIQIDRQSEGMPFSMEDLELLVAVSTIGSQALENNQLHASFLHSQLQDQELQVAGELQRMLVPARLPSADGYRIESEYLPAVELSGDYLDSFTLADGRIVLAIGDVAGKGAGAALLMARVGAAIRLCFENSDDPTVVLERTNRLLVAQETTRFVTATAMVLEPHSGKLSIASAGHCPTLLMQNSGIIAVPETESSGPPLGMVPSLDTQTQTYQLERGDCLLGYTDGLTESQKTDGELFGVPRVEESMQSCASEPARLLHTLLADVRRFVGNDKQHADDLTMILLHRL